MAPKIRRAWTRPNYVRTSTNTRREPVSNPPQGEIDPSAARQQIGGAGKNLVHDVEHQPPGPAHHDNMARVQFEFFCRIAAPETAVRETATIAERLVLVALHHRDSVGMVSPGAK
jgi:hypothetical protein